jgi:hypothetical protein
MNIAQVTTELFRLELISLRWQFSDCWFLCLESSKSPETASSTAAKSSSSATAGASLVSISITRFMRVVDLFAHLMRHLLGDLDGHLVALFLGNVLTHFPGDLDGDVDGDVLAALVGDLLALFLGHFDGDVVALLVGDLVALLLGNLSWHLERQLLFHFIAASWKFRPLEQSLDL